MRGTLRLQRQGNQEKSEGPFKIKHAKSAKKSCVCVCVCPGQNLTENRLLVSFCGCFFASRVCVCFTPACPGSFKKTHCNRRQEKGAAVSAFLQYLNQKPARLSTGFYTRLRTPSHMHTRALERSSSPTSQLYNYIVQQWPPAGAVYLALLQKNAAFCSISLEAEMKRC